MVVMLGITMPVDTLTSHAFGSGNLRLCGLYLNRSLMLAFGTYSIIATLFYFLFLKYQIFLSLGQNATVVQHMNSYLVIGIPYFFLTSLNDIVRRWLNQMKFTYVPMVASIVSLLIFVPTAYLLAIHWKMEIAGLAYAKAIQELIVFCIVTIYVLFFLPQVKDAL